MLQEYFRENFVRDEVLKKDLVNLILNKNNMYYKREYDRD